MVGHICTWMKACNFGSDRMIFSHEWIKLMEDLDMDGVGRSYFCVTPGSCCAGRNCVFFACFRVFHTHLLKHIIAGL